MVKGGAGVQDDTGELPQSSRTITAQQLVRGVKVWERREHANEGIVRSPDDGIGVDALLPDRGPVPFDEPQEELVAAARDPPQVAPVDGSGMAPPVADGTGDANEVATEAK